MSEQIAPQSGMLPPQPQAPVEQPQEPQVQQPEVDSPMSTHTDEVNGEEQQSYEESLELLSDALYKNEQASDALIKMINPESKVETAAKAVIMLVSNIDEKANVDESVFYTLTMEAADRLMELAETQGMEFSEREVKQIAMASWEGIMGVFGGDESMEGDYNYLSKDMSDTDIKQGQADYEDLKRG